MPKSSNWLGLDVFVLGIALFTSVPTASADIITYTFSGVVRAGSFSSGTVSLPQGIETNGTTLFNGTLTYDTAAGVPTLPGDPIAPQGYLYFPTPSSVDFSLFIEGLTWAADGTDDKDSGILLPIHPTLASSFVFASGKPITFPSAPDDHNVLQLNVNSPGNTIELQAYDLDPIIGTILGSYVILGDVTHLQVSDQSIPEPPTWALLVTGLCGFVYASAASLNRRRATRTGDFMQLES